MKLFVVAVFTLFLFPTFSLAETQEFSPYYDCVNQPGCDSPGVCIEVNDDFAQCFSTLETAKSYASSLPVDVQKSLDETIARTRKVLDNHERGKVCVDVETETAAGDKIKIKIVIKT